MKEVILHISAGQGPKECQWVVSKLADAFRKEAAKDGLECRLVKPADGLAASLLLSITGKDCEAFATARIGTVRWIGQSPFRSKHKRKNWYVGVSLAPTVAETPDLKESNITYQAIRASGPGGQHVNKTDSAIRATHVPTGLSCVSQEQRSQFANRKIARLKLAMLIYEQWREDAAQLEEITWQQNNQLERGNEVRCYEGSRLKLRNGKPV